MAPKKSIKRRCRDILQANKFIKRLGFVPDGINIYNVYHEFHSLHSTTKLKYYPSGRDGLEKTLTALGIDVVLPVLNYFEPGFKIPWVGYIYDFQHKYLPDYFTSQETHQRDKQFKALTEYADSIIVNSTAVNDDIIKFYPNAKCQITVLPFSPMPHESWFEPQAHDIKDRYQLPENFVLVSNQFWQHKDHPTVFRALSLYNDSNYDKRLHLICTGMTKDNRRPNYFEEIKTLIHKLGSQSEIHILGYVPKRDQIEIMKQARLIVQATHFEGGPGGGACHDAIALGKPCLISDIKINREINDEKVIFFEKGNPTDLSEKLASMLDTDFPKPSRAELMLRGQVCLNSLAGILSETILRTISRHPLSLRSIDNE